MSNVENNHDDLNSKPEKALKEKKFSYFEPAKGIIFAVVATILFLGFPQVITYVFITALIPMFDATVVRSLWLPIILWALFRIGIEVAYMIERRYTKRLAIITVVGNVLALICGLIIFVSPRILWQGYVDFVHTYFQDMAAWFTVPLTRILDRPNLIILAVMIVVFAIESFNMVRRGIKAEDKKDEETDADEGSADATGSADSTKPVEIEEVSTGVVEAEETVTEPVETEKVSADGADAEKTTSETDKAEVS